MSFQNRTYRMQGNERIEGSWRHVFIKNGDTHFLSDLKIYADGMIDCWGLVDLATFREKVATGWVTTTIQHGEEARAHDLARWQFEQPDSWLTPEDLIAEVADEIERLAGRPTTEERCRIAITRYLAEPTLENLDTLRNSYYAVPEHLRRYLLHDQDVKDFPLRVLITPIGTPLDPDYDNTPIQAEDHTHALAYFHQYYAKTNNLQPKPQSMHREDDSITISPSVTRFAAHNGGHPYLANDYPSPIIINNITFPTVEHAYWTLSTNDRSYHAKIQQCSSSYELRKLMQDAPLHTNWHIVRLSVMTRLLRAKFQQHPDLAEKLIATGDGRLINGQDFSKYWGELGHGRNWLGSLLEIIRAELVENNDTSINF